MPPKKGKYHQAFEGEYRTKQPTYEPSKDAKPYDQDDQDLFDPISKPVDEYMRVPCDIETHTIKSANDVGLLNKLIGQQFVGFSFKTDSKGRPTLLNLGGRREAYLIDLEQIKDTKQLDLALSKVFKHKKTVIVHERFNA